MQDIFKVNADALKGKRLWLFDMDGTIYEENRLFDGVLDMLTLIKESGGRYIFITNNSSKSVNDYIEKLNSLGIQSNKEDFFTSTQATILYLKKNHPDALVYVQATRSCMEELRQGNIRITENVTDLAKVVLIGFDTEMTSERLRKTCEMLGRDVAFIATNPDLVCPVSFGFVPDCGSICQMLENATKKRPVYIGKPKPTMVDFVREKYGYTQEQVVVIGDRLYTDIAVGLNAGVSAVCVLTGEATKEDILNGDIKPTFTFNSVKDIYTMLHDD